MSLAATKGLIDIKKIGIIMSILMGVTLSLFMSLIGTLTSGHFTVVSWLISFAISLGISLIIGFIIPMSRVEAAACRKAKLRPGTTKANLLSALISNTIYTPVMSVVMVLIMVGGANKGIDMGIASLESDIGGINSQITAVQYDIEQLDGSDPARESELQSTLGELRGRLGQLMGQKMGMEASKPSIGKSIFISLLCCYPSGYIIIFIVQPLYLKMLLKKLGPPRGAHSGHPDGMPQIGNPPEEFSPAGSRPEGSHPEGSRPESSHPEGSHPGSSRPGSSHPEGSRPYEK